MFLRFVGSVRRNAIAYAALFFALTGTAVATHEVIDSSDVVDNSLTSADIQDYNQFAPVDGPPTGIQTHDLADNAVTGPKINNGSVTSADLADVQILNDEVLGGIQSQDVGQSVITAAKIASQAVTTGKIALGAVTGAQIADESIDGEKIVPGSLGAIELGDSSVGSSELVNGGVTGTDVEDGGINAIDLSPGSVTSSRIQDGTVETADVANNSVTASKLAAGAINGKTLVPTVVTRTADKKKFGDGYLCKANKVCKRVGVATCPAGMVALEGGTYAHHTPQLTEENREIPVRVGGPVPRGFNPQKDFGSVPASFTPEAWWATYWDDQAGKVYVVCI